ncbi:unnamed protein product [Sphagnum balticum]
MGLAAGVDKWCGKYSPVFRSVCIGRMVGNMIDSYSETMLHFYPSDKRILYKAHTLRGRKGIDDIGELTDAVNKAFVEDEKEGKTVPKTDLDRSELSALMNAASTVSADASVNDEGYGVYQYTVDATQDIEEAYAEKEATNQMLTLAKKLPMIHKKVLRLKDGTFIQSGSIAYVKEELLHTSAWAQKILESDTFPKPFIIVDMTNVEYIVPPSGEAA